MKTYALLTANTVVNIVDANQNDNQDPNFIWIDITNINPIPGIGWTYADSVFSDPNAPVVTLASAKAQKLVDFAAAVLKFTDSHYDINTKFQLFFLLYLADKNGLLNRSTYLQQLAPWVNSVLNYCVTFSASISVMTDIPTVQAATWDFSGIAPDPGITAGAAIQINS